MFYILKRKAHAGWLVCEFWYHGDLLRGFGTKSLAEEVLPTLRGRNPGERFQLIYSEEDM